MLNLNAVQHDALAEICSLGISQAATAINRIVNEKVTMSILMAAFQTHSEAVQELGIRERICAITQRYQGAFKTEAILMFPYEKSLEIVRLMEKQTPSLEELSEMEREAMCEIGNIILNTCMSMFTYVSGKELQGSLPNFHVGISNEILNSSNIPQDDPIQILTLKVNFDIEEHHIHGYIAFLLDSRALEDLQQYLDTYLTYRLGT